MTAATPTTDPLAARKVAHTMIDFGPDNPPNFAELVTSLFEDERHYVDALWTLSDLQSERLQYVTEHGSAVDVTRAGIRLDAAVTEKNDLARREAGNLEVGRNQRIIDYERELTRLDMAIVQAEANVKAFRTAMENWKFIMEMLKP